MTLKKFYAIVIDIGALVKANFIFYNPKTKTSEDFIDFDFRFLAAPSWV